MPNPSTPSAPLLQLSAEEQLILDGRDGPGATLAMRIVVEAARLLGADRLVPITSAHIDGCLYHGDGGVEFAERLVSLEARVAVPTTLNVGALDLLHPGRVGGTEARRAMARRLMDAYLTLGCAPTWTCAPYQAGHRPAVGDQVAWGESNAVAFVNSALGARTNRYGDFLDVACAIVARAPHVGLHRAEARHATVVVDTSALSTALKTRDVFYPVLGSWLGRAVGDRICAITGLPEETTEDQLKALGAAAASTGAVALFHVVGVTPEAPDLDTALGGHPPAETLALTPSEVAATTPTLSTVDDGKIDAVALGSPHFSTEEFEQLMPLVEVHEQAGARCAAPLYLCTGRGVFEEVTKRGWSDRLTEFGAEIVVDTCVVVTPILPEVDGVLMTNSGKFAHYGPGTIGYDVVYGSLEECVESAVKGAVVRDPETWT